MLGLAGGTILDFLRGEPFTESGCFFESTGVAIDPRLLGLEGGTTLDLLLGEPAFDSDCFSAAGVTIELRLLGLAGGEVCFEDRRLVGDGGKL